MRIIKPFVVVPNTYSADILKNIEKYGRICYKSEGNVTDESYKRFIGNRLKEGHESILEHEKVTVKFCCDRGISHEIVRHRIAAYSQESTRYCNYSQGRFGSEITVIKPFFFEEGSENYETWKKACEHAEKSYFELTKGGASAQEARSILPNSLKTEIIVTYNLREWRHFFRLRADKAAHPQMRQLVIPLLEVFKNMFYPIYEDIKHDEEFNREDYADILIQEI